MAMIEPQASGVDDQESSSKESSRSHDLEQLGAELLQVETAEQDEMLHGTERENACCPSKRKYLSDREKLQNEPFDLSEDVAAGLEAPWPFLRVPLRRRAPPLLLVTVECEAPGGNVVSEARPAEGEREPAPLRLEGSYRCGYCHAIKLSSAEGRVRIRCGCGGKHQDGKPRMHTNWERVDPEVELEAVELEPQDRDALRKPPTTQSRL